MCAPGKNRGPNETHQDPLVLPCCVLHPPFVCGKALAKEYISSEK